jgi:hypothetical protein
MLIKLLKKLSFTIVGILLICSTVFSQDDQIPVRDDNAPKTKVEIAHAADLGFGLGMDYGGLLGVQLGFTAFKHLTFFGAVGYYYLQAGWNIGIKTLLVAKTSKHAFRPYFKGMYGTHSVILVDGADQYNKVYNGWTVGIGMELRFGKKKMNGFNFDLNVPLRTTEFWEDYNVMQNDPTISVSVGPMPVAFSLGFHHEF